MTARLAILFEAQAVAMTARLADAERVADGPRPSALLPHRVDALRARAEQELGRADGLRAAILSFATMYELHRRDLAAVQSLGLTLEAAVAQASRAAAPGVPDPADWPAPVGLDRADLQ